MRQQSFMRLPAWQQAMDLAEVIYRYTGSFPAEERSGLTATLRRVASAMPASIATVYGYHSTAKLCDALTAARGTLRELQSYMVIARRMRYGSAWRAYSLKRRIIRLDTLFNDTVNELHDQMQTRAGDTPADMQATPQPAPLAKAA